MEHNTMTGKRKTEPFQAHPSNVGCSQKTLNMSDKGKSTLHGSAYHLNITAVVLLRAYDIKQKEERFNFSITLEDPDAGKFDDVVLRYSLQNDHHGTVYLQSKHKDLPDCKKTSQNKKLKTAPTITKVALLDKGKSNPPFSIPMYFLSFVECNHSISEQSKYLLCTNARIDDEASQYFTKVDPSEHYILKCYTDLEASFYRFSRENQLGQLQELLKKVCLNKLGKLLARSIHDQKCISLDDSPLYNLYTVLIDKIVKHSYKNDEPMMQRYYKFKQEFINAKNQLSAMGILCTAFTTEYKKIVKPGKDVWKDVEEKQIQLDKNFPLSSLNDSFDMINKEDWENNKINAKIDEFYDKFMLVCEAIDEENLKITAKKLLCTLTATEEDTTFISLHFSLFEAMKNADRLELNSTYLETIFKNVVRITCFSRCKKSTEEYAENLKIIYNDIQIKDEWLKKSHFYEFFGKTDQNIYSYCSSSDLLLRSNIIIQTLRLLKHDFLFFDTAKYLKSQDMEQDVRLVIGYLNVMPHSALCVVIILEKHDPSLIQLFTNMIKNSPINFFILTQSKEIKPAREERLLVQNLTEQSQEKLFTEHAKLNLFGTSVDLSSIVNRTDNLTLMFDLFHFTNTIVHAVNKNINIQNFDKIKSIYINRGLENYHTPVTPDNRNQIKDFKMLFDSLKNSFMHETNTFDGFFKKIQKHPIFCDVATSISNNEQHHIHTANFENKYKVLVVLDEAGFGKTTYFTWLAWYFSKQNPDMLVIKLHAIEYSSEFDRLSKTNMNDIDDTGMIRILYQFIFLALVDSNPSEESQQEMHSIRQNIECCSTLLQFRNGVVVLDESETKHLATVQLITLRLFCDKFNKKQLVLLLDGFDEIVPDYTEVVIKCFRAFASYEGIRHIFLSSRPHDFIENLKTSFKNCGIFRLKAFTHNDQILALHKYLLAEMKEYYQCEEEHRTVLLVILYLILNHCLHDLVTAPLLLHMAMENFLPDVNKNVDFHSRTISRNLFSNEKLDILQLVKYFLNRKVDILTNEKTRSSELSSKTAVSRRMREMYVASILRQHMLMAVYVVFDEKFSKKVVSKYELHEIIEEISQKKEKTGIVIGVSNGMPIFIHKLFAEYFAATWLFENVNKMQNEPYFKSQLFWMRHLNGMRYFFDRMIVAQNKSDIHLAVLNKSKPQIEALLSTNPELVIAKDSGGRIPLHYALQHDNKQIMQLLLEKMTPQSTDEKDNLFCWSALDYAFVSFNKSAIKTLVEFGATVNTDHLLQQLYSNDVDRMIDQVCFYMNFLSLGNDAEQLAANVVRHLYSDKKINIGDSREKLRGNTILEYCISKNRFKLFKQLILQLENRQSCVESISHRLFTTALNQKAYDVLCFLIDELNCCPPEIKNTSHLFTAILASIKLNQMKSFKIFLEILCFRLNIPCADDNKIEDLDSLEASSNISLILDTDFLPKSCCVRSSENVRLSIPEYDKRTILNKDHLFETLLARAAHEGNVQIAKYIINKFERTVTNNTIVMVMRLMPKGKRLLHDKACVVFKHLLDKTTDLYEIDDKGRNLLQMTIQNGCFFMVVCLTNANFDRTLINNSNQWNIFHYTAASESKYTNRALRLYQHFILLGDTDRYDSLDVSSNSVYETAILNNNFDIACQMLQTKQNNCSTPKQIEFLLDSVSRLVEIDEIPCVIEYFKYLFGFGDIMWMEVYGSIRQQVPII